MTLDGLRSYMRAVVSMHRENQFGLATYGYRYCCMEELLLEHGRVYEYRRAPWTPFPRQCYQSSYQRTTRRGSPWIYVEGVAINPVVPLPVEHAWISRESDPAGAFELAWDYDLQPHEGHYVGVPFKSEYVREVFRAGKRQNYGVLNCWWIHFPLLSGKVSIEDVLDERAPGGIRLADGVLLGV
jgi:hypothetical protein